jgi:hypothetical protein
MDHFFMKQRWIICRLFQGVHRGSRNILYMQKLSAIFGFSFAEKLGENSFKLVGVLYSIFRSVKPRVVNQPLRV